jgi:hypothetical protein
LNRFDSTDSGTNPSTSGSEDTVTASSLYPPVLLMLKPGNSATPSAFVTATLLLVSTGVPLLLKARS